MSVRNFVHLFRPTCVAVVGASNRPHSVGYAVMHSLLIGGLSHFVFLGDGADADFGDVLDYLGGGPTTRAFMLHLESVRQAGKFRSAARAGARNKPVLVIKAGHLAEGARPPVGGGEQIRWRDHVAESRSHWGRSRAHRRGAEGRALTAAPGSRSLDGERCRGEPLLRGGDLFQHQVGDLRVLADRAQVVNRHGGMPSDTTRHVLARVQAIGGE